KHRQGSEDGIDADERQHEGGQRMNASVGNPVTVDKPAEGIGASVRRREDNRFLTGAGQYTDDINQSGQAYAVFVRSPHAHAKINGIDTNDAMKIPGVVAIYTGADLPAAVGGLPCG